MYQASLDDKDTFYLELAHSLSSISRSDIVVLIDDLNAKAGVVDVVLTLRYFFFFVFI